MTSQRRQAPASHGRTAIGFFRVCFIPLEATIFIGNGTVVIVIVIVVVLVVLDVAGVTASTTRARTAV